MIDEDRSTWTLGQLADEVIEACELPMGCRGTIIAALGDAQAQGEAKAKTPPGTGNVPTDPRAEINKWLRIDEVAEFHRRAHERLLNVILELMELPIEGIKAVQTPEIPALIAAALQRNVAVHGFAEGLEAAARICEELSYPPSGRPAWRSGSHEEWAAIKLEDAAKAIRERAAKTPLLSGVSCAKCAERQAFIDAAWRAHPNLDLDIELVERERPVAGKDSA